MNYTNSEPRTLLQKWSVPSVSRNTVCNQYKRVIAVCPDAGDAAAIACMPQIVLALQQLLDWARDHTSPLDENSPHELLIAAALALEQAGVKS